MENQNINYSMRWFIFYAALIIVENIWLFFLSFSSWIYIINIKGSQCGFFFVWTGWEVGGLPYTVFDLIKYIKVHLVWQLKPLTVLKCSALDPAVIQKWKKGKCEKLGCYH